MKKQISFILIFVCFFLSVRSQDTIYYDSHWKLATLDNASYFRIKWKKTSGWQVKDCYLNGKPQMEGFYSDDSCNISQGQFSYYNEKGDVYHVSHYEQGNLNGDDQLFYDNGQLRTAGSYEDGKQEGEWLGYYPSGKLAARVKFKNGSQQAGEFFKEDGGKNEFINVFSRINTFPGGIPAMQRFLIRNLKYPDSAVSRSIQGTVLVGFNVTKEGKIQNVAIVRSVDSLLDHEALRVVGLMPDWDPLIIGGILCDSYQRQPIIFSLQEQ